MPFLPFPEEWGRYAPVTAACLVQTRQKKLRLNFSIRDWLCNGFHLFVSSLSRPSELGTSLRTVDRDGER